MLYRKKQGPPPAALLGISCRMTGAMQRGYAVVFALLFVAACCHNDAAAQNTSPEPVAIVVHPDVVVDDLSFAQLRKIFFGEQQYWSGRDRITLLVRAPEAYERDMVLRRIYEMNEGQFRQYWIAKIFRSEVTSGPKIVYSTEMARELVAALPGSIAFMRASDVGDGMEVLRIDGKLPGENGYPLQ